MGIVIDIIIIAILFLSIFLGYKKGLIKLVFNLCAFLIALIVTFILYRPISAIVINNTDFDENIKQTILEKGITEKKEDSNGEKLSANDYIEKYTYNAVTDAKNNAVESAADAISINTVNIVVAIALFVVVRILLIFAKVLVGALANLPIVKQFDKAGGILYGIITGLLIIYFLLAIIFFIASINGIQGLNEAIDESIITKYLYANNIILNIFFSSET